MTVNRIDGASENLPEPERNRLRATPPRSPQDEVHPSSRQSVAPKEPTYSPKTVRRAASAPSASRAEKTMAPDARAQKIQAIKDGQPHGWSGEPYLADEVIVPASAVLGFLGLEFDWENLSVTPRLPSGWKEMDATVLFKGIEHTIRAKADGTFVVDKSS